MSILTRQDTQFSASSLARAGARADVSATAFTNLPFEKIYHDGAFAAQHREEIVGCRQAEIVVPGSLDLTALKFIWCRSQAEKTTFLHLLSDESRRQWADKVFEGKKYHLFHTRWTFVERADLSGQDMIFFFNPSTETPGPFPLRITVRIPGAQEPLSYEDAAFIANTKLALKFRTPCTHYTVEVRLDDVLAYQNSFVEHGGVL